MANTTCFAVWRIRRAGCNVGEITFTFAAVSIGFDNDTVNCMVRRLVDRRVIDGEHRRVVVDDRAGRDRLCVDKVPVRNRGSTMVSSRSTVVSAEGSIVTVAVVLPAGIFTEPAELVNVVAPDCV